MSYLFFFNDPPTTEISTLSLHDALPILVHAEHVKDHLIGRLGVPEAEIKIKSSERDDIEGIDLLDEGCPVRSEEHTSELQSLRHLVCRLLLEKKKKTINTF